MFRQRFSKYILYPFKLISNCIEKFGSSDPTESGSSVPDTILIMLSQSTVEPCGRCIKTIYWRQYNLHANNTDTHMIVVLVFRALHGLAPAYLSTLITPYEPRRALRSTDSALLCVPRHKLERYGRRSFSCAGPVLWNSLPEDMRLADSLNSFKSHLKTHYFKLAYNLWFYAIRTLYVILPIFIFNSGLVFIHLF